MLYSYEMKVDVVYKRLAFSLLIRILFYLYIYIAYGIGPKGSTQKTLLACSKVISYIPKKSKHTNREDSIEK